MSRAAASFSLGEWLEEIPDLTRDFPVSHATLNLDDGPRVALHCVVEREAPIRISLPGLRIGSDGRVDGFVARRAWNRIIRRLEQLDRRGRATWKDEERSYFWT